MVTCGPGRYPTSFFLKPIANDDLTSMRLIIFGKKGICGLLDNLQSRFTNTDECLHLQKHLFRSYQTLTLFVATTADCGPPPFLLNGAVSYQATTEGSEGHYQCNDGFTLEGGMTTVCGANGSWDSTPICRPQTGI